MMGRRVDVAAAGLDDAEAAAWLRSAELRIRLSTAPDGHPTAVRLGNCRRDVNRLRGKLEAARTPPAQIVGEVRAVLAEHGYLAMVDAFAHRAPVVPRGS
jgi:hypothetical protein